MAAVRAVCAFWCRIGNAQAVRYCFLPPFPERAVRTGRKKTSTVRILPYNKSLAYDRNPGRENECLRESPTYPEANRKPGCPDAVEPRVRCSYFLLLYYYFNIILSNCQILWRNIFGRILPCHKSENTIFPRQTVSMTRPVSSAPFHGVLRDLPCSAPGSTVHR